MKNLRKSVVLFLLILAPVMILPAALSPTPAAASGFPGPALLLFTVAGGCR